VQWLWKQNDKLIANKHRSNEDDETTLLKFWGKQWLVQLVLHAFVQMHEYVAVFAENTFHLLETEISFNWLDLLTSQEMFVFRNDLRGICMVFLGCKQRSDEKCGLHNFVIR